MKDYIAKIKQEDNSIAVCLYIENNNVLSIGDKMNEINENAYMNGYNWDAFLNYYVGKHHPEVLEGLDSDPEAGMYCAFYEDGTPENEEKADKLIEIITDLIENEAKLYEIVTNEGNEIEWD